MCKLCLCKIKAFIIVMRLLFCASHLLQLEAKDRPKMTLVVDLVRLMVASADQAFDDDVAMALLVDDPFVEPDLDPYSCNEQWQLRKLLPLQPSLHPTWGSLDKYVASDPSIDMDPGKDQVVKAILVRFVDSEIVQPSVMVENSHLETCVEVEACEGAGQPSAKRPETVDIDGRQLASSSQLRPFEALLSLECHSRHFEAVIGPELPSSCR